MEADCEKYHVDKDEFLPMLKLLSDNSDNISGVLCEMYILHHRRIPYDRERVLATARKRKWLRPEGTPVFCLGYILANEGLYVTRKYDATIEDIKRYLKLGNDIIVGVSCQKLYEDSVNDDSFENHAVVVTQMDDGYLLIFDPQKPPYLLKVREEDFLNAWQELHCFMIRVLQSVEEYEPRPINVDSIPLDVELQELQEAIAENVHEVWASTRIKEGWKYGKARDDDKKLHPDIVPYLALPESEKEYDRKLAFETIKLVGKLGFKISKQ